MEWLDAFLASGVRFTTPILLAGLGCLATAWTRDLNVGLEGAMVFAAFFGVVIGLSTSSWVLAVVLTTLLGAAAGLLFGFVVTVLRVNVFVAGIVLNVLGAGGTVYLLRTMYGVKGTLSDDGIPAMARFDIPVLKDIPVLSGLLSGHTALTYLSWVITVLVGLAVVHTVAVRRLKSAGEHPDALLTAGGSVTWMRIAAQSWCLALCGLAGVQLSLGQLSLFTEGMTSGIGFVALAAVIFCRGRLLLLAVMCFVFGLSSAASVQISDDVMPSQFAQMIPYVIALLGLVVLAKRSPEGQLRIATPTMEN